MYAYLILGIKMEFCVYSTTYWGDKMPSFYIGSSSVKKVKSGYHGSVKSKKYKDIWEQELKDHPELFDTTIIALCETRKEALEVELKVQQELNVVKSSRYINMSLASINGFFGMEVSGAEHPLFGKKHSIERRIRNSESHKGLQSGENNPMFGKSHTKEARLKISEAHIGIPSWNKGISIGPATEKQKESLKLGWGWNKGIPMSEEQKHKLRKPKPKYECIHCSKSIGGKYNLVRHQDSCKQNPNKIQRNQ